MDAEAELERFIARFSDAVAADVRAARARMRALLPAALELVAQALARAPVPLDSGQGRRVVIKSISAKQRPRRS